MLEAEQAGPLDDAPSLASVSAPLYVIRVLPGKVWMIVRKSQG